MLFSNYVENNTDCIWIAEKIKLNFKSSVAASDYRRSNIKKHSERNGTFLFALLIGGLQRGCVEAPEKRCDGSFR